MDEWGDGFFFFADARGTTGTNLNTINGTTFGVVKLDNYAYLWNDSNTVDPISHTEATYSPTTTFTLSIERNNMVFKLKVNGTTVYTISDSNSAYYLIDKQSIYPSIRSFNTYAEITDYGIEKTAIDGIVTDSNLDDWKILNVWNDVSASAKTIVDSTNANKKVTFYSLLTDNGLHLAVEAKHAVTSSGYWAEWWRNTNVEFFIGVSSYQNQFYATELINHGFNYYSFVTTGTSGNYTTIFEGFIDLEYLTHIGAFNGDTLKIGYAFKVDDLSGVKDEITINGEKTSYWIVDGLDPLLLNDTITKVSKSVTPTPPASSSSSSSNKPSTSSSDISSNKPSSSSLTNNSSSSSTIRSEVSSEDISSSSENSQTSSFSTITSEVSSEDISSSQEQKANGKKGCGGSIFSLTTFLPLAFIAVLVFIKKQKNI
ncbi:MAG: hypothetical protein J6C97_05380 [Clostridia bacterium]|nr:hypothetical protein [Clostridia bacterium]